MTAESGFMTARDEQYFLYSLERHFHGAGRVQLKHIAGFLGVSERTIRNNKNALRIAGRDIYPISINGRLKFDLMEIASALANVAASMSGLAPDKFDEQRSENLKSDAIQKPQGRKKKQDLAIQIGGAKGLEVHR